MGSANRKGKFDARTPHQPMVNPDRALGTAGASPTSPVLCTDSLCRLACVPMWNGLRAESRCWCQDSRWHPVRYSFSGRRVKPGRRLADGPKVAVFMTPIGWRLQMCSRFSAGHERTTRRDFRKIEAGPQRLRRGRRLGRLYTPCRRGRIFAVDRRRNHTRAYPHRTLLTASS